MGERVAIDARSLWVVRAKPPGDPVLFLPGAGSFGLDYYRVYNLVEEHCTPILYDRAGTGWSEDVALPRTLDEVTDEIADLLSALGVESTVTLVGHSLGGAYAQHFAQRFPDRVARLVLIDPLHQDWDDFVPPELQFGAAPATDNAQMPELPAEAIDQIRTAMEIAFSEFPAEIGKAALDLHMSTERFPVGFLEGLNAAHLLNELREGGPLPKSRRNSSARPAQTHSNAFLCPRTFYGSNWRGVNGSTTVSPKGTHGWSASRLRMHRTRTCPWSAQMSLPPASRL